MNRSIERWFRGSSLVRALYQGAPIVALHRALATIGLPGTLGMEFSDFSKLGPVVPIQTSEGHSRQRVLFVIPRNFRTHATFQASIAQALTLRGADCAIAICGGIMPVCEVAWSEQEVFPRCARCMTYITELADLAGISRYTLSDYRDRTIEGKIEAELAPLDTKALTRYVWNQFPIGKFAIPPTRWRLRSHDFANHPQGQSVVRGFIRGGVRWAIAIEKVLQLFRPDVVVMLNGLFMEERVTWAVSDRQGCRCVFFEKGRDAGTVFLSHGTSAPRYDIRTTWDHAGQTSLNEEQRQAILNLMNRRVRGEQMVETYWAAKESDEEKIRQHLRLDLKSPLAVLFTNVVWDTAMQDRDTVFDGMLDWLQTTIQLFRTHPQWTLIIRIHPAETQVPGRESHDRVAEWIQQDLGSVPENIRLVLPEAPIDSYVLIRMAQVGLVYASTVGLEMAVAGTPVVVAGDAHYSGKGFTYDPSHREDYANQVETLMTEQRAIPRETQVDLALSYAHIFFLRRTLPMTTLTEQHEARPRLAYHSFPELMPGVSAALDIVCDGILTGREFEVHR